MSVLLNDRASGDLTIFSALKFALEYIKHPISKTEVAGLSGALLQIFVARFIEPHLDKRTIYAVLNTLLSLPAAVFSLIGGVILSQTSYRLLFDLSSVRTTLGWLALRAIPDPRNRIADTVAS